MSAFGGVMSGIGMATGEHGTESLVYLVKNKPIQSSLDDLISQYKSNTSADSTDLNSYIQNYLSQAPQAAKQTGQETGAIGSFYSGDVANTLAGYRAQQSQLGDLAVQQALAQNRGMMNRSTMGGGSGDSSWNNRYGIGVDSGLNLNNDLANLNQSRQDYSSVLNGQIGNAGRRQALQDALTQRGLVPMQARQGMMGADASELSGLTSLNNANNMFGARYNPSMADAGSAIASGLGGTLSQGVGVGSSIYGGLGGGGGGSSGGGGGGGM